MDIKGDEVDISLSASFWVLGVTSFLVRRFFVQEVRATGGSLIMNVL